MLFPLFAKYKKIFVKKWVNDYISKNSGIPNNILENFLVYFKEQLVQYFDKGIVDYTDAVRFALIFGLGTFVGREIIDYFRRKKNSN